MDFVELPEVVFDQNWCNELVSAPSSIVRYSHIEGKPVVTKPQPHPRWKPPHGKMKREDARNRPLWRRKGPVAILLLGCIHRSPQLAILEVERDPHTGHDRFPAIPAGIKLTPFNGLSWAT